MPRVGPPTAQLAKRPPVEEPSSEPPHGLDCEVYQIEWLGKDRTHAIVKVTQSEDQFGRNQGGYSYDHNPPGGAHIPPFMVLHH